MSEFTEYIATTKFNIGQDKETNIVVEKGEPVYYDGTVAKIGGKDYTLPRLQSAIKSKWLITPEELGLGADFRPASAQINMRAPTPQGEDTVATTATMADEEREVSSLSQFREGTHQSGNRQAVSAQEGQEVQGVSFKTKAGKASQAEATRVDNLSQNAIRRMEEGEAGDKEAHFREMERQKLEREIASLRSQLAGQPKQVREGISFENEGVSATASDTTAAAPTNGEVAWDGEDAEVVGKAGKASAASPVEEQDMEDKEARLAFARKVLPDFDWDFDIHWKTKLKSLDDNPNPTFVCMVYAVESDAMKKHIANAFPEYQLG